VPPALERDAVRGAPEKEANTTPAGTPPEHRNSVKLSASVHGLWSRDERELAIRATDGQTHAMSLPVRLQHRTRCLKLNFSPGLAIWGTQLLDAGTAQALQRRLCLRNDIFSHRPSQCCRMRSVRRTPA